METPSNHRAGILNFPARKSTRSYCQNCGTGRRPKEHWRDLCDCCIAWRDARHYSLLARRRMQGAR